MQGEKKRENIVWEMRFPFSWSIKRMSVSMTAIADYGLISCQCLRQLLWLLTENRSAHICTVLIPIRLCTARGGGVFFLQLFTWLTNKCTWITNYSHIYTAVLLSEKGYTLFIFCICIYWKSKKCLNYFVMFELCVHLPSLKSHKLRLCAPCNFQFRPIFVLKGGEKN